MPTIQQSIELFNILIEYLAKRDIENLDPKEFIRKLNIERVDLLILLGNSSLFVAERAARAYGDGLVSKILICGGIGHSTPFLYSNVKKHPVYCKIETDNRSEAEIFQTILTNYYQIREEMLLIEKESTNCGANALEAYQLLKKKGIQPKSVLLMQDPALQFRSEASFRKVFQNTDTKFISFASFIPYLKAQGDQFVFQDKIAEEFCDIDRFLSLILGEIPRLKNDENGYGPKGKGFIIPVEIPERVLEAYEQLLPLYGNYIRN